MTFHERASAIVGEALERPEAERAAFLDEACGGDAALRAEVESLIAASDASGEFLEVPAAVAAGLADEDRGLVPGQALGPYHVEREIARGGMGVVYLAEDTRLGRQVAIKVLPPAFVSDPGRRERLRLEARAAAALSHTGIATVYALEDLEGYVCLVSEYVPGESLRSELARGPLPIQALLRTGIEVARALAAAHAAGVVHRDLKPENIVRHERGHVKLVDFGIARLDAPLPAPLRRRLTEAGMVLGTPAYMSPEQLDGGEVDGRTDIFSLGVLLFELATARNPFEATTPVSTAARVLAADPPPLAEVNPALPWELDWIIRGCLRKRRAERYQSAGEVARDLEQLLLGRFVPDRPMGGSVHDLHVARRWWDLHQAATIAVSILMVVLGGFVHEDVRTDLSLGIFLALIAAAAVNWVLRLHLLFTRYFNRTQMGAQLRRTEWWLRGADVAFAVALFAAAVLPARERPILSAFMAAVALGWIVTASIVEPATRRAAFPQ